MRHLFITLLLFAFLAHTAFADCVGYYEEFDVRVLDGKIRPVEGALVQVKFDRGTSFGEQYFTTQPTPTDAEGKVHMKISNQGTDTHEIDCRIYINASAGGLTAKKTITVGEHGPIVDLTLDVYNLNIYVRNQEREAVANATITINGESKITDSNGYAKFHSKTGEVHYLASYLKGKKSGAIPVSDDTTYEITLPQYHVTIDVMDDKGQALYSVLEIFGESYELEDGHYETDEVFGEEVDVLVRYAGVERELTIIPAEENEVAVVFDTHPPVIEIREQTSVGGRPRLTMSIADPGQYASGVNPQSISVSYRIIGETGWAGATTYVSGTDSYTVDFPELQKGKIIEFRIEIRDEQGNTALQTGRFATVEEPRDNITENGEKPQENGEGGQEIPLFYIVIGVILIILVLYIVKYLKSKKENYEGKQ